MDWFKKMFLLWRSNEEIFWFHYYTFFTINICACSQNENLREERTSTSISDYSIYSGTWTSNRYDENYIYTQAGGAILSAQIEENHLKATYVYVQKVIIE